MDEPLQSHDDTSTNPLTLIPSSVHPGEHWLLRQARLPIATLDRTPTGASLSCRRERWRSEVRRHGFGWCLAVTAEGASQDALTYYPRTGLLGGRLVLLDGSVHRLRCPLVAEAWRLGRRGRRLGRIRYSGVKSSNERRMQIQLASGSREEPQLLLIVLVARSAILVHEEQPHAVSYSG